MGGMMGWVEQPGSEQQRRAVRTNLKFDGKSKVTSTRHRRRKLVISFLPILSSRARQTGGPPKRAGSLMTPDFPGAV